MAVVERNTPLSAWNRYDTQWYVGIAAHGYHWSLDGKPALAFFPLYPLLLHLASGWGIPAEIGGMLLSNAAFAAALLYLYLFAENEWGAEAAHRASWLLAVFPTAFFTFATYTESLFLLCAVATLYHARKHHVLLAGLWLAAALTTRSTGIILIPAVLVALHQHSWRARLLTLVPVSTAVSVYVWYLQRENLTVSTVLTAQRHWHRALAYPWTGFTASVQWLVNHGTMNAGWTAEDVFQLSVTVLFLGLTIVAWRSLGHAQAIYCGAFWLVVLTSPEWLDKYYAPFSSMDRFVLALFPLAGWAAVKFNHRAFRGTVVLSAVLMGVLAALHLSGGWVG